jgi:hypothetical protein
MGAGHVEGVTDAQGFCEVLLGRIGDREGVFFAQETGYGEKGVGFFPQETGMCRRRPTFLCA